MYRRGALCRAKQVQLPSAPSAARVVAEDGVRAKMQVPIMLVAVFLQAAPRSYCSVLGVTRRRAVKCSVLWISLAAFSLHANLKWEWQTLGNMGG